MVNKEFLMIACMGSGGILFALGGTGLKYLRRFVLPLFLGSMALWAGFDPWRCFGYAMAQSVTFCLPYGERTPWPVKMAVFASYALPSLFFGFSVWQVLTPIVCIGAFFLSNWKPTAQTFLWKIVEFVMGSMVGITVASLI